jgi:hypothetical protein
VHLVCICPTFRKPRMVENTIAQFLAQDYTDAELVILDDADELPEVEGDRWRIISVPDRFHCLGCKYRAMIELFPEADAYVSWDDDDVYLPWHLAVHAAALADHAWSKPSVILSDYNGLHEEQSAGRFHGAIAWSRQRYEQLGGYPCSRRADLDQAWMHSLGRDLAGDTCKHGSPSYVFRWGTTQHYHSQGWHKRPDDETWYDEVARSAKPAPRATIVPALDPNAEELYRTRKR